MLTGIHFNHNSEIRQADTAPVTLTLTYPKFKKGEPSVRKIGKKSGLWYGRCRVMLIIIRST